MAFQISKKRTAKPDVKDRPKEKLANTDSKEPPVSAMFVQNQKATAPEWRVAQALNRRGIGYDYQKEIMGGRDPGGVVLDFYVYTVPLPTPMNVNGDYWHRLSKNYSDTLKEARTNAAMGQSANQMVVVWERDLGSVDDAYVELGRKGIW